MVIIVLTSIHKASKLGERSDANCFKLCDHIVTVTHTTNEIPRIFFSGALTSVGSGAGGGVSGLSYSGARNSSAVITVLSVSSLVVVSGMIVAVDLGACEMPFFCIFERMRSVIRCPGSDGGVFGAVTACVGFDGSISISGVTFSADSFFHFPHNNLTNSKTLMAHKIHAPCE